MSAWAASARPSAAVIRPVSAALGYVDCFASPGPTGRMAANWPWATIVPSRRRVSAIRLIYLPCPNLCRHPPLFCSIRKLRERSLLCSQHHPELHGQVRTGLQWRRWHRLLRLCGHSQAGRLWLQGRTELSVPECVGQVPDHLLASGCAHIGLVSWYTIHIYIYLIYICICIFSTYTIIIYVLSSVGSFMESFELCVARFL